MLFWGLRVAGGEDVEARSVDGAVGAFTFGPPYMARYTELATP